MEIVQMIVTAVAAGAAAALESTAGQVVQDTYGALKAYLQEKYAKVHLQELEQQPDSQAWRAVVAEELTEAGAAGDQAVVLHVQRLLDALAAHASTAVIGIDLASVRAAALNLAAVTAQGTGPVTGVRVQDGTFAGPIEIHGVTATQQPVVSSPPAQATIKVLFLAASPRDNAPLRTAEEARAIDLALRQAGYADFAIIHQGAVQIGDLQSLLMRHQPDIVHFSGHGKTDALLLQDEQGQSTPVPTAALRDLFQICKDKLRCVVLNACYTDEQATAIAAVVDCVVGMSDEISDEAARDFATAFYGALGAGRNVQTAFAAGRNRLDLSNLAETAQPVLKAIRVDPATVVFGAARNL
ncbi:MAG: CHAT domain-containing protein [Caldilineaceae bacterium]